MAMRKSQFDQFPSSTTVAVGLMCTYVSAFGDAWQHPPPHRDRPPSHRRTVSRSHSP